MPLCDHCSREHQIKDCIKKMDPPKCNNCVHTRGPLTNDLTYSATKINVQFWAVESKIKSHISIIINSQGDFDDLKICHVNC